MTTYNITPALYEEMAERCADNATFTWDCIELDGFAVIFGSRNGKPYDVEVLDEENNDSHPHNFDLAKFEKIAANL